MPAVASPLQLVRDVALAPVRLPLRVLDTLVEPARIDLRRNVRRSLGVPPDPVPPAEDPDDAFLAPGSVARRVHGDLPSMLIGGLSALLLQSLHPLAMAGVADHSNYQDDALGRLRRTASFVGYTTFGTVEQADDAIEQVRRVHRRVHGIAPDGRPYSADDPDLVTWIHVAEMTSFLASCQRFGRRPITATRTGRLLGGHRARRPGTRRRVGTDDRRRGDGLPAARPPHPLRRAAGARRPRFPAPRRRPAAERPGRPRGHRLGRGHPPAGMGS